MSMSLADMEARYQETKAKYDNLVASNASSDEKETWRKAWFELEQEKNDYTRKAKEKELKQQKDIANLEEKNRLAVQNAGDKAALERLQSELSSRLQIVDKEQAGAMARLEKELGVRREDMANQLTMSRERLGFDREKLAADVQSEREKLAFAREEMEKIGIPKMLADKWYQEQQVILAQEAQKIDRERIGVERGRLGLEAFTKAVELASSPASRFQFGDFATGLARNAQARDWTAALTDAVNQSGFGVAADAGVQAMAPQDALAAMLGFLGNQPGTSTPTQPGTSAAAATTVSVPGAPAPVRTDFASDVKGTPVPAVPGAVGVMGAPVGSPADPALGGGGDYGGYGDISGLSPALQAYLNQNNAELGQIAKIADAGASALAPGVLEGLGETGLAEFVSGLKKLRRDDTAWLSNYAKTRPYQGTGPEASWAG